jgi:hypothetical protein
MPTQGEQLDTMEALLAEHMGQNDILCESLLAADNCLDQLQHQDHRGPSPKVSQPEPFSGQRSKLTAFITQLSLVLKLQGECFHSEHSKVLYAGSFLRDTAFAWFQAYLNQDNACQPTWLSNYDELVQELKNTFGDPNEKPSVMNCASERGLISRNYL